MNVVVVVGMTFSVLAAFGPVAVMVAFSVKTRLPAIISTFWPVPRPAAVPESDKMTWLSVPKVELNCPTDMGLDQFVLAVGIELLRVRIESPTAQLWPKPWDTEIKKTIAKRHHKGKTTGVRVRLDAALA